jgi:hypothetical protein
MKLCGPAMSDSATIPWLARIKRTLPPVLLVVAIGFAYLYYNSEPRYQGRRFSEWMRLYEQGVDPGRAERAIYGMGPDAVPHLAYCLTSSKPGMLDRMVMSIGRLNQNLGFKLSQATSRWKINFQGSDRSKTGRESLIAQDMLKNAPEAWKPAIISAMKEILEKGSVYTQQPALLVMQHYAADAGPLLDALREILKDANGSLLRPTLDLMREMGEKASSLGPELIPLFIHPDMSIQSKAILVGAHIKMDPQEAMPALKPMLDSMPGEHRRMVAVKTLAEIALPEEEQMRYLKEALDDPSEDIRNYAAYGLGRLGVDAIGSLDALIPLLKDEVIGVRATAATAIGNMGPAAKPAIPHLFDTMNNDFSGVGQECRVAIEKIDPEQAKNIIIR